MIDSAVRTRFAPSPTGYLHVGGARTALFCWLFARKAGGNFLLRIEDTDQKRNTAEAAQAIFDGLNWLGLNWDEEPLYQSRRLEVYNAFFKKLLEAGRAYECFLSPEELEQKRAELARPGGPASQAGGAQAGEPVPRSLGYRREWGQITDEQKAKFRAEGRVPVLRFKMPDRDITVDDQVFGPVTYPTAELEDFVIRKGDGFPTYHFAVVVDDAEMRISHVIRGQEHLGNTPKHIALQEALGLPTPIYAHLPILLNPDGSKISKRQLDDPAAWAKGLPPVRIGDYLRRGYLPEAMINFLALLGWNPKDNREIMTREEMVEAFDLRGINKTNAQWNTEKLNWMNQQYFARMDAGKLVERIGGFFRAVQPDHPAASAPAETIAQLLPLYRERAHTLVELADSCGFLFGESVKLDEAAVKKVLLKGDGLAQLTKARKILADIEPFAAAAMDEAIKAYCDSKELGLGKVAQPIRVAVSGGTVSPPIFETLEVLGKPRTLARIDAAIAAAKAMQAAPADPSPPTDNPAEQK
jgi:glutamyl-tRNA synthetase